MNKSYFSHLLSHRHSCLRQEMLVLMSDRHAVRYQEQSKGKEKKTEEKQQRQSRSGFSNRIHNHKRKANEHGEIWHHQLIERARRSVREREIFHRWSHSRSSSSSCVKSKQRELHPQISFTSSAFLCFILFTWFTSEKGSQQSHQKQKS